MFLVCVYSSCKAQPPCLQRWTGRPGGQGPRAQVAGKQVTEDSVTGHSTGGLPHGARVFRDGDFPFDRPW